MDDTNIATISTVFRAKYVIPFNDSVPFLFRVCISSDVTTVMLSAVLLQQFYHLLSCAGQLLSNCIPSVVIPFIFSYITAYRLLSRCISSAVLLHIFSYITVRHLFSYCVLSADLLLFQCISFAMLLRIFYCLTAYLLLSYCKS